MSLEHSSGRAQKNHPLKLGERLAVSIAEAHALLGISRASLYRRMDEGTIVTFRVGKRRLVPLSAIHDLIARAVPPKTTKGQAA